MYNSNDIEFISSRKPEGNKYYVDMIKKKNTASLSVGYHSQKMYSILEIIIIVRNPHSQDRKSIEAIGHGSLGMGYFSSSLTRARFVSLSSVCSAGRLLDSDCRDDWAPAGFRLTNADKSFAPSVAAFSCDFCWAGDWPTICPRIPLSMASSLLSCSSMDTGGRRRSTSCKNNM